MLSSMFLLFQAVLSGNTEVPARNLHQHIQNLMQTDPGDNVTPMELEFKNLANVKAEPARYLFMAVTPFDVLWNWNVFDPFLTDRNIKYKENLSGKKLETLFSLFAYICLSLKDSTPKGVSLSAYQIFSLFKILLTLIPLGEIKKIRW